MAKASISPLERGLDAMITQIEKEQEPREITFETYWGDEVIPDDGSPVFVTEWGGGPMDEDKEATRSKYDETPE